MCTLCCTLGSLGAFNLLLIGFPAAKVSAAPLLYLQYSLRRILQFQLTGIAEAYADSRQSMSSRSLNVELAVTDHGDIFLLIYRRNQLFECFFYQLLSFVANLPSNSLPTTVSKYCAISKCSRILITRGLGLLDAMETLRPASLQSL